MKSDFFRLVSTYELMLTLGSMDRPVRIEVFRSLSDTQLYRARVWAQNTYNLYPTFLNTGQKGEDLRKVHSSDQIDADITSVLAEEPDLLTGKHYRSEEEFLAYVKTRVADYQKLHESPNSE